ncbi:aldo/keto reductase [Sphingomonas oleivorans]|uniref:Aldo/keto reductase n=1 Tax=Sphingomonas oleivorans TaxID=1735121 RepID=A0A2T5G2Z2_9SPHN|nr:aldo/keto reductase [Sphingomonas oleivorans]PTQ13514.1 aldo/keto reductase [Sphingomonas oleivorans]
MSELILSSDPRPLGRSGLTVSPIAWGMWRFAGCDVPAARARIDAAREASITLFDTADIYGLDSEGFGTAEALLGRVFGEDRRLRDDIVLATKGGIVPGTPYDSSTAYLLKALDASLARLGVDHVDLYQIHRPDLLAHPADVAAALTAMVESGKVRAVGVSNHTPAQTAALQAHLPFPLVSHQPELSPLALAPLFDGLLDQAVERDMAVLAWSPLGGGRLTDGTGNAREKAVAAALGAKAEACGVSLAAATYAWLMAHPARPIPIVGSQRPDRIREAADAFRIVWTRAEWYEVLQLSLGERLP